MEAIQRIVSRQLTDLSQKRQSHRLKADETSIFPMESHAESVVAFSSPFHLLDLETASNCKPVPETPSLRTSASTGSISSSAYSSNSLSSGRQSQKTDDFATEWSMPEKQNRLQQPFKKVRQVSNAIRDKFSTDFLKSPNFPRINATKNGTRAGDGFDSTNGAFDCRDTNDNSPGSQFAKIRKQARVIDVRGKLNRKKRAGGDNQNLLLFEEVENDTD
ncbi:hypothetical protein AAVH_01202 [Aphelenchoides avenae]|nr:hypothetical protein AAVH_01202 [Aphelenchus avenae]